jgi:hypothetical protein
MEMLRSQIKGYHPFLIAIVDADLEGERYGNLFAANTSAKGLGIVTIANVPDIILPAERIIRLSTVLSGASNARIHCTGPQES